MSQGVLSFVTFMGVKNVARTTVLGKSFSVCFKSKLTLNRYENMNKRTPNSRRLLIASGIEVQGVQSISALSMF